MDNYTKEQAYLNENSAKPEIDHKDAQDGWTAYNQHRMQEAESFFRRAIGQNSEDVDGLYALGMVLRYSGKSKEAVQAFNEAINVIGYLEDNPRGRMIRNLAIGHIHQLETGDWNLEKEIWSRKD